MIKKNAGFTLLELILATAIILTTAILAMGFYSRFLNQNAVANVTDQIVQNLRKAQSYAMMSRKSNSVGWGVNYDAGVITLYQGTNTTGTIGYQTVGSRTDTWDSNIMDGTRLQAGSNGAQITTAALHVGSVDTAPNNQYQFGIYSDAGSGAGPVSLIGQSGTGTLTANAWNTLPISATIAPNAYFWLIYNTNGRTGEVNDIHYNTTTIPLMVYSNANVAFGTWPASFGPSTTQDFQLSMYVTAGGRNTALDEKFSVPGAVTVSGLTAIDFARITGIPSTTATITVGGLGTTKTILVNKLGGVSRQ